MELNMALALRHKPLAIDVVGLDDFFDFCNALVSAINFLRASGPMVQMLVEQPYGKNMICSDNESASSAIKSKVEEFLSDLKVEGERFDVEVETSSTKGDLFIVTVSLA